MSEQEEGGTVSKYTTCWLIVFSGLGCAAVITLVVLLAIWGNTGIIGTGSIAIGSTCSNSYFKTKFSNMTVINFTIFIGSCISSLALSLLLFVFIGWVCINQLRPTSATQIGLSILSSLAILTLIPAVGYYLSFLIEFNQCSNNTIDFANTLIVLILAAGAILMACLILAMVVCQSRSLGKDQNYKRMATNQTQQNQQRRYPQRSRQNGEKSPVKIKEEEYTKEKIHIKEVTYESPPKRRTPVDEDSNKYQQKNEGQQLRRKFLPPQRPLTRDPHPISRNAEHLTQNLHPDLRHIDPRRYLEINKPGYSPEDDQSFMKESRKYHDYDHRSILARRGYEEPDRRRDDDFRGRDRNQRNYLQRKERDEPYREDRYRGSPYEDRPLTKDRFRERQGIMSPFARNRY